MLWTTCTACGADAEFPVFLSDGFYDCDTYFGTATGSLYFVNLEPVKYEVHTLEEVLEPALHREGGAENLLRARDLRPSPCCPTGLIGPGAEPHVEKKVMAYVLPQRSTEAAPASHAPHLSRSSGTQMSSQSDPGWALLSGEDRHAEAPQTFWIPDLDRRESLRVGDLAKLLFDIATQEEQGLVWGVERMWVRVTKSESSAYVGVLPLCQGSCRLS